MNPASASVKRHVKDIRCRCGKCLGSWDGETVVIRKLGLVLRGGWHTWTCPYCGTIQEVDLRLSMEPILTR